MADAKKILIIEDERPMARALELKLSHEGFGTQVVHNGEQGIESLEKDKFDLVICDLVMPKRDGFQVLEFMNQKEIKTPVIVLSNLSQDEDRKKAISLGAKDFYIKSDTPISKIVDHVNELLK